MSGIVYNYRPSASQREFLADSKAAHRSAVLRRFLVGADVLAAIVSGAVSALILSLDLSQAAGITAGLLGFAVVLAFFFGLYSDDDLLTWSSGLSEAPRLLLALVLLSWPLIGLAELMNLDHPLLVAFVTTVTMAPIDSVARALARGRVHQIAPLRQRTLIVGSGLVADRLAERLERHTEFGLQTVGLIDDDVHTKAENQRLSKLGSLSELDAVLVEHKIDRVIIAFSRASHQELLSCIRTCRDNRVAVDVVPRLFELTDGARAVAQVGGLPVFSVGAPPLTPTSRVAKRALDVTIASLILLVLSPLLLVIALAIKLTSRGPIFFTQVRAGRGDTTFKLIKFRSMYRDADERKRAFDKENDATDGVMFKIKRDPRITSVGRILRRSSIDELPQLLNVLKGEMSLVGPRPLILSEAKHAAQSWHARRVDLRPGITGLWQVSGRSDIPFQEMVRFDYQYVSGWSLARDIEILLATIPVVLSGRGAY